MLFLAINEFNPALMQQAADILRAKNLKKLLSFHRSDTITDDREERHGLDPWVQWVSIYTGKPSAVHGIEHLGDISGLEHPQIWEILDRHNVSYGIWGAMNAGKRDGKNCAFFFPDPWNFEEKAFPRVLNDLLALPRYYSKNYLDIQVKSLLFNLLKLLRFTLQPTIFFELIKLIPFILRNVGALSLRNYFLFAVFDLVNATLFKHYHKHKHPKFSFIFFNSLAHAQHHCWKSQDSVSKELLDCFIFFDKCLEIVFSCATEHESIFVANAFTQRSNYSEGNFLYRQKDPKNFFKKFALNTIQVEQLMTNDSHLFFLNASDASHAARELNQSNVDGEKCFQAQQDPQNPLKIFCQFLIWRDIPKESKISLNKISSPFYEHCQKVTRQSGCHVPNGHFFSNKPVAPESIYNHEIFDLVLKQFNSSEPK